VEGIEGGFGNGIGECLGGVPKELYPGEKGSRSIRGTAGGGSLREGDRSQKDFKNTVQELIRGKKQQKEEGPMLNPLPPIIKKSQRNGKRKYDRRQKEQ